MTYRNYFLLISLFFLLFSNAQSKKVYPKNEFRAVWIATVANIDWPQSNTDPIEKQKADFIKILENYKKLNYNVVIVQIRSNGDALYPSTLAPWSRCLTGKEGIAPPEKFNPLEWMITEAHSRGFEFHAWLNPYRASSDTKTEDLSPEHDAIKHPEWMLRYGGKIYYNPGLPEVQDHLIKVVEEVVKNYDIDAIHFDDYFYPYTVNNEHLNDTESFRKYRENLNLGDWRRSNVNSFVQCVYTSIKSIKPWVQFGISPFGIWRNKSVDPRGSDTEGPTNYDSLYADPLFWMENSWIDYILPQLYWSIDHPKVSYSKLAKWWADNTKNAALYIGNGTYKIKADTDKSWEIPEEIPNQIELCRNLDNIRGNASYSAKWFVDRNGDVAQLLADCHYRYPAIPLPVPNARKKTVSPPKIIGTTKEKSNLVISFLPPQDKIRFMLLYGSSDKTRIYLYDPSYILDKVVLNKKAKNKLTASLPLYKIQGKFNFAITFIDYYGNESKPTFTSLK